MVNYLLPFLYSPFFITLRRRNFRLASKPICSLVQKFNSLITVTNRAQIEGRSREIKRLDTVCPIITTHVHETSKKPRKRRRKYSFVSNHSIARNLDLNLLKKRKAEKLAESGSCLENRVLKDMAEDHVYRRVQLFYYLSVIYYRSGCLVERAGTILQHGKSNITGFSAAHSSILTHVKDNFFKNLKKAAMRVGIGTKDKLLLSALGVSEERLQILAEGPLKKEEFAELMDGIEKESLIGKNCSFFHNMNSTVELPHFINEFDTVVEDFMRTKGIEILNEASSQGMHPYTALTKFVGELWSFLDKCKEATETKITLLKEIEKLEDDLWKIEERFSQNLFSKYLKILQKIGNLYKMVNELRPYSLSTNLKGRLTWQKNYFSKDSNPSDKQFQAIKFLLESNPREKPSSMKNTIDPLKRSLAVIELQRQKSLLPEATLLSGKIVKDRLIPLTDEELFFQKLSLLQRI